MNKILKLFTVITLATIVALSSLSFTACASKKDPDKIYVGMECGYAPFNYTQTTDANGAVKISNAKGYANGYDVMIAKKIAEALKKELVIVKYEFDALIPAVQSDALDFIIAGMSPTEERLESVDFSDAYYESQLVIVVRKDGEYASATSLSDFKGAKIVAQIGTFHDTALEAQASTYGIIRQTPMKTFPLMINALNSKAIDGYVAEEPSAVAHCSADEAITYIHLVNNANGFTASKEEVQIAVGLKKGSSLKNAINEALSKIDAAARFEMMTLATQYATA